MKKNGIIQLAIIALVFLLGLGTGFALMKSESNKHFEAACHMSDLIRDYSDCLNGSDINDYGCFEELQGFYLQDGDVGNPVDLNEYVWTY